MPGRTFDPRHQVRRHELSDLDFVVEERGDALLGLPHQAIDHDVRIVGLQFLPIRIFLQRDAIADHQFLKLVGPEAVRIIAIGLPVTIGFDQALLHHQHVVGQVLQ